MIMATLLLPFSIWRLKVMTILHYHALSTLPIVSVLWGAYTLFGSEWRFYSNYEAGIYMHMRGYTRTINVS